MEFDGVKQIEIGMLGLSQIYLSSEKITSIEKWFDPQCMENFQPLCVHDFGNQRYTITDGHTRAYVAYKNGISVLPAVYDRDDIVTGPIGQMLYKADIDWCERFRLSHIMHLENRILDRDAYQKLWIGRCDRSYDLLTQASDSEQALLQKLTSDLFLYGASEDMSIFFFENKAGQLFMYQDGIFLPE
ncbi:MAG: hypothetical protein K2O03_07870 [Lachnospiraceae bacterium]|nr:hypothetical protein [Lachnospiraceae bacterium]